MLGSLLSFKKYLFVDWKDVWIVLSLLHSIADGVGSVNDFSKDQCEPSDQAINYTISKLEIF